MRIWVPERAETKNATARADRQEREGAMPKTNKVLTIPAPGVLANDDVSLTVGRGEIVALLGENGAGKSTLMNILSGLYTPDAGEVIIDGKKIG